MNNVCVKKSFALWARLFFHFGGTGNERSYSEHSGDAQTRQKAAYRFSD